MMTAEEEHQMTSTDFLKRLCEGYVRCYRTFNLQGAARKYRELKEKHSRWADFTFRELNFFASLGEMLGFVARSEAGRRDLLWFDADSEELVLYLERESNRKGAPSTMKKLLETSRSKARYLVVILGWVTKKDFISVRRAVASHLKGRSLLVLAWVGENSFSPNDLEAVVVSDGNVWTRRGKSEPDKDDYWYAHFVTGWQNDPGFLRGGQRTDAD